MNYENNVLYALMVNTMDNTNNHLSPQTIGH